MRLVQDMARALALNSGLGRGPTTILYRYHMRDAPETSADSSGLRFIVVVVASVAVVDVAVVVVVVVAVVVVVVFAAVCCLFFCSGDRKWDDAGGDLVLHQQLHLGMHALDKTARIKRHHVAAQVRWGPEERQTICRFRTSGSAFAGRFHKQEWCQYCVNDDTMTWLFLRLSRR